MCAIGVAKSQCKRVCRHVFNAGDMALLEVLIAAGCDTTVPNKRGFVGAVRGVTVHSCPWRGCRTRSGSMTVGGGQDFLGGAGSQGQLWLRQLEAVLRTRTGAERIPSTPPWAKHAAMAAATIPRGRDGPILRQSPPPSAAAAASSSLSPSPPPSSPITVLLSYRRDERGTFAAAIRAGLERCGCVVRVPPRSVAPDNSAGCWVVGLGGNLCQMMMAVSDAAAMHLWPNIAALVRQDQQPTEVDLPCVRRVRVVMPVAADTTARRR
jgi:hypothetical protein